MKIIRPITVTAAMLTSNVPEDDYPLWNNSAAYTVGQRVLDLANHDVYEAVAASTNKPVTDTTSWVRVGKSNRWRMFDQSIGSQTSLPTTLVISLTPNTRADSVVGLNIKGVSKVDVVVTDPLAGTIYSKTVFLTSDSGITNWYSYYYEPIEQEQDFILTDLPISFSSGTIEITFHGTPSVGCLVLGLSKEIGITTEGASVGIVDYGTKTKDVFGNYSIKERGFSKRADFNIKVNTREVDSIQNLLTSYRSIPVVYVGTNTTSDIQFKSTVIYGFYKDFSIDITYPPYSTCSLQVESLA